MNQVLKILLLVAVLILPFVIGMPDRSKTDSSHENSLEDSDEFEIEDFIVISSPLVCGGNMRKGANGRCRSASRFIKF